jgi:hypothetical protein
MWSCCATCVSAWAAALAKSSVSALTLLLVLRTGSQEKNSCRQCRAFSHIRLLPGCNKRPDPGPIGQLGSYCSPAQAMKANTTTAAMKSKLSASPNNGTSAAFVARVDVVLLNTFASMRPSPIDLPHATMTSHQGENWLRLAQRVLGGAAAANCGVFAATAARLRCPMTTAPNQQHLTTLVMIC